MRMRIVCATMDPQSLLLLLPLLPQHPYRQSNRLDNNKAGLKKCRVTGREYDKQHNTTLKGAAQQPALMRGGPNPLCLDQQAVQLITAEHILPRPVHPQVLALSV